MVSKFKIQCLNSLRCVKKIKQTVSDGAQSESTHHALSEHPANAAHHALLEPATTSEIVHQLIQRLSEKTNLNQAVLHSITRFAPEALLECIG